MIMLVGEHKEMTLTIHGFIGYALLVVDLSRMLFFAQLLISGLMAIVLLLLLTITLSVSAQYYEVVVN